jgi:hypothetical protein
MRMSSDNPRLSTSGFHSSIGPPIARGFAMALALFTLVNIVGASVVPGFDANIWWIDLGFLPHRLGVVLLLATTPMLICFATGYPDRLFVRRGMVIVAAMLLAIAISNVIAFYRLTSAGRIHPCVPLPLSLLVAASLGMILRASLMPGSTMKRRQRFVFAATIAAVCVMFPVAQMFCFGKTDYRGHADAIVVFGARVYADGTWNNQKPRRPPVGRWMPNGVVGSSITMTFTNFVFDNDFFSFYPR